MAITKTRDVIINISLDPSISGYGGYDEWFIEELSSEKINSFLDDLDKLVKKHKGYFTGHN